MARQIIDLNRLNDTTISSDDLVLIRDMSEKEDKAASISTLAGFIGQSSSQAPAQDNVKLTNLPEYDISVNTGVASRSSTDAKDYVKLGKPFVLDNPLEHKIKVQFSCAVMFSQNSGGGSSRIHLGTEDMTRVSNSIYTDLNVWSVYQLIGSVDITAKSSVSLYLIAKAKVGSIGLCDATYDIAEGITPRLIGRTVKVYG